MNQEKKLLLAGIQALQLEVSEAQLDLLMRYLALLVKWNKAYNLSAIRDPLDMVRLHLLDSLVVGPQLQGEHFADVGTGAGLPGIPLAILYPSRTFTLVDSAGKKTRFLTQVKQDLGLDNVTIHHARIEQLHPANQFDGILSRAFASLVDMTERCKHLLSLKGMFYAMKGQDPIEEIRQIEDRYRVVDNVPLQVPGVDAQRCMIILQAKAQAE